MNAQQAGSEAAEAKAQLKVVPGWQLVTASGSGGCRVYEYCSAPYHAVKDNRKTVECDTVGVVSQEVWAGKDIMNKTQYLFGCAGLVVLHRAGSGYATAA